VKDKRNVPARRRGKGRDIVRTTPTKASEKKKALPYKLSKKETLLRREGRSPRPSGRRLQARRKEKGTIALRGNSTGKEA